MNTETELPADVIAELEANRKISALKLLRSHRGIDLKEAKNMIDAYIDQNPSLSSHHLPESDSGIGRIVILVIGVGVIYGIYKFFT